MQGHKGAKWDQGKGNTEYELPTEQHSLCCNLLIWFLPLTKHIPSHKHTKHTKQSTYQREKKGMTYSDLGVNEKTQCYDVLIGQAFIVPLLWSRYIQMSENTNINNLWCSSLILSQFKIEDIFVESSSTDNNKIWETCFNNNKIGKQVFMYTTVLHIKFT